MLKIEAIRSPLTGEHSVTLCKTFSTKLISDIWRREYGVDIEKELHGAEQLELYRCDKTQLLFFHPSVVMGSAAFYDEIGKIVDWYYPKKTWYFKKACGSLPKGAKVLEIGCGEGNFLEFARDNDHEVEGIDFNSSAIARAKAKKCPGSPH
jgi:hypothetical protein